MWAARPPSSQYAPRAVWERHPYPHGGVRELSALATDVGECGGG